MRDLNRRTAGVLDELERGEVFELRRHGKAVAYLTPTPPLPQRKPDWKAHFNRLRQRSAHADAEILEEFEKERQRQADREQGTGGLK